jgi:gp16 family phage-associated protein
MPHMLCYKLIPLSSGIVGHGFQEAANRFLVAWRDASVLGNQAIFDFGKSLIGKRRAYSINDKSHVKTQLAGSQTQVRRRGITGAGFVVPLGTFGDAKFFGKLILGQTCLSAQLSQTGADLFRKSQYFSTRIFTLAVFCHILRSSSHENARNCTMPNTSISEQARIKAREALEKRGQTAKNFAELHNLNPSTVYAVLSGQSHCRRGEAHRAAVLLGIKDGVIEQ